MVKALKKDKKSKWQSYNQILNDYESGHKPLCVNFRPKNRTATQLVLSLLCFGKHIIERMAFRLRQLAVNSSALFFSQIAAVYIVRNKITLATSI